MGLYLLVLFASASAMPLIGDRSRRGWTQFAISALILCFGFWLLEQVDGMSYAIVLLATWGFWAWFGPAGGKRDWRRIRAAAS